ncbi:hypothetical protein [Bradyrhizobium murdochi]|uniref:hypothetical protein n=1 Tax=Bradyrhizobium murdochi TaxID=1038859 RepID=UPI000487D893|nr:hypothetical protein [Bradyrhizobium murdochi]
MKAAAKPTTIQMNNNVNVGTVSMFNIPDTMPAAYQRMDQNTASVLENARAYSPRDLPFEVLDAFGVGSSRIPGQI